MAEELSKLKQQYVLLESKVKRIISFERMVMINKEMAKKLKSINAKRNRSRWKN